MSCHVIDLGNLDYAEAFTLQKDEVERVQASRGGERLYFVEHPHVISVGRNADGSALLAAPDFLAQRGVSVANTDRGGDATYHGPGQLVGYPILALEDDQRDIRRYVFDLEEVLLRTLLSFGVRGRRHAEHRGAWIADRKIASLGIRISRWVTMHGFALNVSTDLDYFKLIHPCGIVGCEMTSLEKELGAAPPMDDVKATFAGHFGAIFNRDLSFLATTDQKEAHVG